MEPWVKIIEFAMSCAVWKSRRFLAWFTALLMENIYTKKRRITLLTTGIWNEPFLVIFCIRANLCWRKWIKSRKFLWKLCRTGSFRYTDALIYCSTKDNPFTKVVASCPVRFQRLLVVFQQKLKVVFFENNFCGFNEPYIKTSLKVYSKVQTVNVSLGEGLHACGNKYEEKKFLCCFSNVRL